MKIASLVCVALISAVLFSNSAIRAQMPEPQDSENRPYAGVEEWKKDREQRMAWWREARFGLFIHWGLYSAAGGYWDGKKYDQAYAEWIQNWAAVPCAEYSKQLKPKFTAAKFDARRWAEMAKEAGMKYALLTAKHHEGYTLFNSNEPYSKSNDLTGGTNISPPGRDLAREYAEAFRAAGLKVGFYYSLIDWQHPDAYEFNLPGYPKSDRPRDHEQYVKYLHNHLREIMTGYGQVDALFVDFSDDKFQGPSWHTRELLQDIKKWQPQIVMNNRFWSNNENANSDYATPEKYVPATGIPGCDWEVNHTMNESYGFSFHDKKWKSVDDVIRMLVEIVSKGGNLVLNVGPTAEGEFPPEAIDILRGVGRWMKVNGESIYGTTASPFDKPAWGRATKKPGRLYLHVTDWPKDGKLDVPLKNRATKASLLADPSQTLTVETSDRGFVVHVPEKPLDVADTVVAVDIEGEPEVVR